MKTRPFSIIDAITFACQQIIEHFSLWLGVWLIQFAVWISIIVTGLVLTLGFATAQLFMTKSFHELTKEITTTIIFSWPFGLIFAVYSIGALCIMLWLHLGITQIALDLYDHGHSTYKRLFIVESSVVLRCMLACLILFIMVIVGFVLFIIPSIFVIILFLSVPLILIDKHTTIVEAFTLSYHLNSLAKAKLFTLVVFCVLLSSILMLIPFGTLFTPLLYPFFKLIFVYAYRQLLAYDVTQESA